MPIGVSDGWGRGDIDSVDTAGDGIARVELESVAVVVGVLLADDVVGSSTGISFYPGKQGEVLSWRVKA